MSKYKDIRQDFWREEFEKALVYDAYLAASDPKHRSKWKALDEKIRLTPEQESLLGSFARKMFVLVYSGIWCGDCVRQGPILHRIAQANPRFDLRFSERVDDSPLANELRMNGAFKVPVVVFLSEDFFEVARFGDRTLSAYRRVARATTGPACDAGLKAPAAEDLSVEIQEWIDIFERAFWMLRLAPQLRERYGD